MKKCNLHLSKRAKVHWHFYTCCYSETVENLHKQFTEKKLTKMFIPMGTFSQLAARNDVR